MQRHYLTIPSIKHLGICDSWKTRLINTVSKKGSKIKITDNSIKEFIHKYSPAMRDLTYARHILGTFTPLQETTFCFFINEIQFSSVDDDFFRLTDTKTETKELNNFKSDLILHARDFIIKHPRSTQRSKSYYNALKKFKNYVDKTYPGHHIVFYLNFENTSNKRWSNKYVGI